MRPIVFLDFDDVLAIHADYTSREVVAALKYDSPENSVELWENLFNTALRANLKYLFDEFQPLFVISSSWATYLSRQQVRQVLTRGGLRFVADALHGSWRSAFEIGTFRVSDISAWLQRHARESPSAYVILDDTSSGMSLIGSALECRTVFCREWHGFVDNRLAEAQQILRAQVSK